MVIEQKHALEGGLAIDQDGGDLAVLYHRLAVDGYDIAVFYFWLHAVALAQQREVGVPIAGDFIVGLDILLREDGCAAGDLPHTRDAVPLRQWLEPGGDGCDAFDLPDQIIDTCIIKLG